MISGGFGMSFVWALLVGALGGMFMAVQGSMNSALGKVIGNVEATLFVHSTAALSVLAILLFQNDFGFQEISKVPWYLFLGGILGILITFAVIFSIPRAGVAAATTAIIVGQVGTALLIDHLGLFHLPKVSFAWPKLVGLGLLAAGALLMLRH